jgi:deuterolysin
MFQTILPGEAVTASVNAAKTFKLGGVDTATVTAIQGFKFVTGTEAPTKLSDTTFCEAVSNAVAITPDQTVVAESVSRSRTRNETDQTNHGPQ